VIIMSPSDGSAHVMGMLLASDVASEGNLNKEESLLFPGLLLLPMPMPPASPTPPLSSDGSPTYFLYLCTHAHTWEGNAVG
jgi:hypothetical protein